MTFSDFQSRSEQVAQTGTYREILADTKYREFEEHLIWVNGANLAWLREYRREHPRDEVRTVGE